MSQHLNALTFPLHGSRLIEASAGTGKTWTIAALYLRLVLGHDQHHGFQRPLLPSEILVMTFTRAATKELSNRIRERLVEAARYFRGAAPDINDSYLCELIAHYPEGEAREYAAYRLMLAAESMDEAAVLTIDSWCQRMLREHAFDSGSLFDEELLSDDRALFNYAVRDYWRLQVYPLNQQALDIFIKHWPDVFCLEKAVKGLINNASLLAASTDETLLQLIERLHSEQLTALTVLKDGWLLRINHLDAWVDQQRTQSPKGFHGAHFKEVNVKVWFAALRDWANQADMLSPALNDTAWNRLTQQGMEKICNKGFTPLIPEEFDAIAQLRLQLEALPRIKHAILRHAVCAIAERMATLKLNTHQFGFNDLLLRLKNALEGDNGPALRQRIISQYPVAMIDEFQDTSPDQYAIFNALYQVADNNPATGLLLIGDPKQSIYGFRGADITSYLAAREATQGRHYLLGTNFRSTQALVDGVNAVFDFAEHIAQGVGFSEGAFKYKRASANPLPFEAVQAKGRDQTLVGPAGKLKALTFWCNESTELKKDGTLDFFAQQCAQTIVELLNEPKVGFASAQEFVRLQAADIAILVRDRHEAAAIRQALQQRAVPSVYLSDKDSVIGSEEAADILRWLTAVANPLDSTIARCAYATRMAGLPLSTLVTLASDDRAWEPCVEQLKNLHVVWQRQGVLAMLRKLIHELDLPARLLTQSGGERSLTNLLHLAEILQTASLTLDGEQSLIRWLAEQRRHDDGDTEERILRLESDAALVKVCTVHKSKGLEYPLVFIPFGVSAKPVTKNKRSFFEYTDAAGFKQLDLALSATAQAAVERARIEEDLRLLYVALTRARYAVWLGVASVRGKIEESALGYLLTGGESLSGSGLVAALTAMQNGCDAIQIEVVGGDIDVVALSRQEQLPTLLEAPAYTGQFERDWAVGSFSALTRAMTISTLPVRFLENNDPVAVDLDSAPPTPAATAWHRFPRGSRPGQFLHEQLEWMGTEGFNLVDDPRFPERLFARCERAGWGNREQETLEWLSKVVTTPLKPFNVALTDISNLLPEMEFWFPSEHLVSQQLDLFCQTHLLAEVPRAPLPERALHGLLMGFADLVFEQDGKYWVLDYKSNFLGPDDSSYHQQALVSAMAAHRYDIQGAIYLLALHRLLKHRLGAHYSPETHLGGAIFYFLRGVDHIETHGCYHIPASTALLDGLDQLFLTEAAE